MSGEKILKKIKLMEIVEPPHQLRQRITEEGLEELKMSLAKIGLLSPIRVKPEGKSYIIESGHRRYLAAKELGWEEIECLVVNEDGRDIKLRAIHENLHREDMSPVEEALAVKALIDEYNLGIKEICKIACKSETWVKNRLEILKMDEKLQDSIDKGIVSVGGAIELSRIDDPDQRAYYTEYAIKYGATKELCQYWRQQWEVARIANDSSNCILEGRMLEPPPKEVEINCFWCEKSVPIRIINHLRVCPKCMDSLIRGKEIMIQEMYEERKREEEAE